VRTSVAAIVVVGMVGGCQYGPYQFTCTGDASCGPGGTCEVNGFCSFPDGMCPSGRRFGDLGGPSAGQCVGSCYGSDLHTTICFTAAPTGMLNVSQPTFNTTGTDTLEGTPCAMPIRGGAGDCVIAAGIITISAPLRAIGARPLVLVAADSISVPMSIDVGSHRQPTESPGAGADADPNSCAGTPPTGSSGGTSGGGAGGSFMGAGGSGGSGGGSPNGTGGTPGAPSGTDTSLRGGCPGQDGASKIGTNSGGAGGHGGGAVLLIAGNTITVDGTIKAGGEGGAGATGGFSGGGGGGAGGMIDLDAPLITVTGTLIANGGGGGGGAGNGSAGAPGNDAVSTTAASGGSAGTAVGHGGNGSAGAASGSGGSGMSGSGADGGGGGGGGAGLIKGRITASPGSSVSPAATP